MRPPFIDFGLNSVPPDPQTPVRDFWGACFVGFIGFAFGFAGAWWLLGQVIHTSQTAFEFLNEFSNFSAFEFSLATLRGFGALCAALLFCLFGFVEAFKPRERLKHHAGRRYLEGNAAIKKIRQFFQAECAEQGEGIQLSKDFKISLRRETTHGLILGAVGAGKTTIAHHILKSIFERKDKAIIVDWKGDFTAAYPALIFNPLDPRSKRWAVALDIQTELDATAFASQMIPDAVGGSGDNFFTNAAREVFTALVIKLQKTKPAKWTWADLYAETCADFESIHSAVATHYPHALQNIAEEGKTTQSVLATMLATCGNALRKLAQAELDNPKVGAISIASWLKNDMKTNQIILGGSPEYKEISRALMSAFITAAAAKLTSMPDSNTRRVWFVVDEFPLLGKVDAIQNAIAFGRSKGARVWLLAQDIAQIRETYGQNIAKALPSMLGTIILGQTQGGETAETIAKQWIGTRIVERRNITTQGNGARSSSFQRDEMLVVHPSELQTELGIKNNRAHALLIGCGDYVYNLPWTFVAPKKFREGFVLRDCFAADKTTAPNVVRQEQLQEQTTQIEAEKEDAAEAEKQAVEHVFHEVSTVDAGGMVSALLNAAELLQVQTKQPTAAPTHAAQQLKQRALEQEQEQEQGD